MEFGIVGLGRMGANLGRHAVERGHRVVGYDRDVQEAQALAREGLEPTGSLPELASTLKPPRVILIYVPAGAPTESICQSLRPLLFAEDVVVDGGNSHWEDSRRRAQFFAEVGVRFLDMGTSGGVSGARRGACFMVGGERRTYDAIAPLLRDLAVDDQAVLYAGPSGWGHFTKLVHNAIEFGMVQAIAEGVALLMRADSAFDVAGLFTNWEHGSVIRGWLVELMSKALREHADLDDLSSFVEDTGEVKWMLAWALEHDVPVPVVAAAQGALMQYRDADSPSAKAVALLRNQYGGHPLRRVAEVRFRPGGRPGGGMGTRDADG